MVMSTKNFPRVFRSQSYIMALTGSIIGIVAGIVLEDATVSLAIIGLWSIPQAGRAVRGSIDASKGQYYDKETGKVEVINKERGGE